MDRIGQTDQPGESNTITLHAGRNEYEAFQIGVHAPEGGLTGVSLIMSDLASTNGARIPSSYFTLYREHYVYVSQPSPDWRGTNRPLGMGWYADALIPFLDPQTGFAPSQAELQAVPVNIPAGQNQPFWVDLFVPADTPAGTYQGAFIVISDQGTACGSVTLEVWNFVLPTEPSLNSAFQLETADTLSNQIELLKHKLNPMFVDPADERLLIDDWGLTSTNLGFWSGAYYSNCTMETSPPTPADLQAEVARHQSDLLLYNYTADEIDNCMPGLSAAIREWGLSMHAAGVHQLVTMTPTDDLLYDGETGRSIVDWWVMLPSMIDAAPNQVAKALAKGDQVWFYTALVQDNYSPKWEIDYAPINYRIPALIDQSLGLTGILYWSVDHWTDDPWQNVQTYHTDGFAFPGEGMLMYPGDKAGMSTSVPSMRLKWIREGVEDYEYVQMLKTLGYGDEALAMIQPVAADWSHWTQEAGALEAVRIELGDYLQAMIEAAGADCTYPPCEPHNEASILP
jgi:hypothetical protein